jgi:selenoprotein W-related protein
MPVAASLAAAVRQEFAVEPKMTPGGGGVFDVVCNGKLVFSKHQAGRFPETKEILDAIHQLAV